MSECVIQEANLSAKPTHQIDKRAYFDTVFCAQVSIFFFAPPLMTTLEGVGLGFLAEEGVEAVESRLLVLLMGVPRAACCPMVRVNSSI